MAVLHTLAAIGRFIRRTPPPPADLLEAYAHEVIPVLDRAEWLYEYWLEQSTLFTDSEKLGNVAAIHRWETATMGRSLERVIPPSVLASAHERVVDALDLASRAAQLLSNGSRFHNANAVCEGHAMLAVSRERRLAALRAMRPYLAGIQPVAGPDSEAASSEMLAEAAALVTLQGQTPPAVPLSVVAPVDREQPGADSGAALDAPWPERAELDLVLADAAEPEPAWLSAAKADTTAETASAGPADQPGERPEAVDAPGDTSDNTPAPDVAATESPARNGGTRGDPPGRAGWGSLFGGPPEQPDR